jgi:hypothetical protein
MTDEPIPYTPTDKATILSLQGRVEELEHILRHFDRASMDLHHYVRAVEGRPTVAEWELIREQIQEMVDPYGPRNPNR